MLRTLPRDRGGLSEQDVLRRHAAVGPNALAPRPPVGPSSGAQLMLLLVTALVSFMVGERDDAVIIGLILAASVWLGFVNEYRAQRTAEAALRGRHVVVVVGGGTPRQVDVTELRAQGQRGAADLGHRRTRRGTGVVVATGGRAEFGRIAVGLGLVKCRSAGSCRSVRGAGNIGAAAATKLSAKSRVSTASGMSRRGSPGSRGRSSCRTDPNGRTARLGSRARSRRRRR